MADTPERKVKKKVLGELASIGAYYTMPVTSGFGNSGVPDILCCYNGWFIGNVGIIKQLILDNAK